MGIEFLGSFPHNPEKTPEGRVRQENASKEKLANFAIGFGTGYAFGKGLKALYMIYQEANGIMKNGSLDPMIAEMRKQLNEPMPSLGIQAFEPVVLKSGQKGASQLNKAVKEIASGGGTPRIDEFGNHTYFKEELPPMEALGQGRLNMRFLYQICQTNFEF